MTKSTSALPGMRDRPCRSRPVLLLVGALCSVAASSGAQAATRTTPVYEHTYANGTAVRRVADTVWLTLPPGDHAVFVFSGDTVKHVSTPHSGRPVATEWIIRGDSAYMTQRAGSAGAGGGLPTGHTRVIPARFLTDLRDEPARAMERELWRRSRALATP